MKSSVQNLSPIRTSTASAQLAAAHQAEKGQRLHDANTDFEALLLRQLVVALRKTIPQSESQSGLSASNKMYDHFIEEGLAQHLADAGGIGLADVLALQNRVSDGKIDKK